MSLETLEIATYNFRNFVHGWTKPPSASGRRLRRVENYNKAIPRVSLREDHYQHSFKTLNFVFMFLLLLLFLYLTALLGILPSLL